MVDGLSWRKDNYKNPYDYEKKLASKIPDAKREIASGAFSGDYDVTGSVMIDCKFTDKKSFSLKHDDFEAICKRSNIDQIPAMAIHYNQFGHSVIILREQDFIGLMEGQNV
jgi:hypothetical protein